MSGLGMITEYRGSRGLGQTYCDNARTLIYDPVKHACVPVGTPLAAAAPPPQTSMEVARAALEASFSWPTAVGACLLYVRRMKTDWEMAQRPIDGSFVDEAAGMVVRACGEGHASSAGDLDYVKTEIMNYIGWDPAQARARQAALQPVLTATPRPSIPVGTYRAGTPTPQPLGQQQYSVSWLQKPGQPVAKGSNVVEAPQRGTAVAGQGATRLRGGPAAWGAAEWAFAVGVVALAAAAFGRD